MPDARIRRTRATLPVGYQFGHARFTPEQVAASDRVNSWHERQRVTLHHDPDPRRRAIAIAKALTYRRIVNA